MGIAALAALTKIISRLGPMQILASLNAVNFKQEVPQMGFLAIALLTLLDSQMGLVVAATRITILSKLDQMPKLVSRSVMKVSTEIMMESAIVKKPSIQFIMINMITATSVLKLAMRLVALNGMGTNAYVLGVCAGDDPNRIWNTTFSKIPFENLDV